MTPPASPAKLRRRTGSDRGLNQIRSAVRRRASQQSNRGLGAGARRSGVHPGGSADPSMAVTVLSHVAAEVLGISTETLRRLVKAGKIAAVMVRERWRFDPREVALYRRFGPPVGRVHHVAHALGIHVNTVIAWERRGRLRAVRREHGERAFNREDVVRLAKDRARCGELVGDFCPWCWERGGLSRGLSLGPKGNAT